MDTDGQTDRRMDGQTDRRMDATKRISSLVSRSINSGIPILPVGILDFCEQKLLAPPLKPMNHTLRIKPYIRQIEKSEI